ncbi:MAG: hypothetical protein ACRDBM_04580 [Sporomusa sp.]
MLLVITIIILGIAGLVLLLRGRLASYQPDTLQASAAKVAGSTSTGVVLSYLVSNFLIDSQQYKTWSGLDTQALKDALSAAGIMTETEFDSLNEQIAAGGELYAVQSQSDYRS